MPRSSVIYRVYKIDHLSTGRSYIGVTSKTVEHRWKVHVHDATYARRAFGEIQHAIRAHGPSDFSITELESFAQKRLAYRRERALIKLHRTLAPDGMNATTGGEKLGGSKFSAKVKKALSDMRRGKPKSAAHIAAISLGLRNRASKKSTAGRK